MNENRTYYISLSLFLFFHFIVRATHGRISRVFRELRRQRTCVYIVRRYIYTHARVSSRTMTSRPKRIIFGNLHRRPLTAIGAHVNRANEHTSQYDTSVYPPPPDVSACVCVIFQVSGSPTPRLILVFGFRGGILP